MTARQHGDNMATKQPSRWHLMPKSTHRGNQTYALQRKKEIEQREQFSALLRVFCNNPCNSRRST